MQAVAAGRHGQARAGVRAAGGLSCRTRHVFAKRTARAGQRINARGRQPVDRGVEHVGDRAALAGDQDQVDLDELAPPSSRRASARVPRVDRVSPTLAPPRWRTTLPTWIHGLMQDVLRERLVGLVEEESGMDPAARPAIEREPVADRARGTLAARSSSYGLTGVPSAARPGEMLAASPAADRPAAAPPGTSRGSPADRRARPAGSRSGSRTRRPRRWSP